MATTFTCEIVEVGKRWKCTDGTKSWLAGESYRYNGKLASEVEIEQPLPSEPSDPGREQPEKGANQDPNTWKVVNMKNPPDMFKVVDDEGINVADNFKTEAGAQAYIDSKKSGAPQPEPVPTPPVTGGKDPLGIVMIMASKQGGRWETKFENEVKWRNYRTGKKSEWSNEYKNRAGTPIRDAETTYYVKVTDFKNSVDTFSLKRRSGNHSSNNPTEGTCYDFEIMTDGSDKKTLEVERPHPKMHDCHQRPLFPINASLIGKWIGIKTVDVNVTENGKEGVYLAQYVDFPVLDIEKPPNNWRLRYEVTDTGQLEKGLITKPFGDVSVSRIDGIGKGDKAYDQSTKPKAPEYRYASVREITNRKN
jgi:hypothetical protein